MRSREAAEQHAGLIPEHAASAMPGRGFSLLRASVATRLGLVAVVVGLLWLSVLWALT